MSLTGETPWIAASPQYQPCVTIEEMPSSYYTILGLQKNKPENAERCGLSEKRCGPSREDTYAKR